MFGKFTVRPSTEEMIMEPGEIDGSAWKNKLSSGAQQWILQDTLRGICSAMTNFFITKGKDKDFINAKANELIALFIQNGDVSKENAKYMQETDFAEDAERWGGEESKRWKLDKTHEWMDSSYYEIAASTRRGVDSESKYNDELQKKMNERELALIKNLREAQKKLWDAEDALYEYTIDASTITVNECLVKYGDFLSKVDAEWYASIMKTNARMLQETEKRIKSRKAEEDAAMTRPTEAK